MIKGKKIVTTLVLSACIILGLVSPSMYAESIETINYTESKAISDIFPDANLAKAFAKWMGLDVSDKIISSDVQKVKSSELELSGLDIKSIEGLQILEKKSMYRIVLSDNDISDLSPIGGLSELKILTLHNNVNIVDLSPLRNLTSLEYLMFAGNKLNSLEGLENLTNLTNLNLNGTGSYEDRVWVNYSNVTDLTPLKGLKNLEKLYLNNHSISDITPIANLGNLKDLNLSNAKVETIPENSWTSMQNLQIVKCGLKDISRLSGMPNIWNVGFGSNLLMNVEILGSYPTLKSIDISYNYVTNIDALYPVLDNLNDLGVQGNYISGIYEDEMRGKLESIHFFDYGTYKQWVNKFHDDDRQPIDRTEMTIGLGEALGMPIVDVQTTDGKTFEENPTIKSTYDHFRKMYDGKTDEFRVEDPSIVTIEGLNVKGLRSGTTQIDMLAFGINSPYTKSTLVVSVIPGTVTVNYLDENGSTISSEIIEELEMQYQTIESKEIPGYVLNDSSAKGVFFNIRR